MTLLASILLLSLFSLAYATTIPNIKIVSCYDADTCRVNLPRSAFNDDWAYDLFGHNIPIRVEGIDTPEIRGQCQKEKDLAIEARDLVRGLLNNAQAITLTIDDDPKEVRGKYFRIVGRLVADGVDISDLLIQRQVAVPYDGGTKVKDWCG
ncbi:MAG: thermonuclease family protein [Nitrospinae bacterium]|nr:thermonuclease family protein [Nitrospinota bacterium]